MNKSQLPECVTEDTTTSASEAPRKKILHAIALDVSGSMKNPLKLRSNARDADRKSTELEPKRVQAVFDVICRLAEDGIAEAKDRDVYAAVLGFGLRHVRTCDLLAFLDDRTRFLEIKELGGNISTLGWSYDYAETVLIRYGIPGNETGWFLKEHEIPWPAGEQLWKVTGRRPLVKLLAEAGAPNCEKYVEKYVEDEEKAGEYFMHFSDAKNKEDLEKIVESLPEKCKRPPYVIDLAVALLLNPALVPATDAVARAADSVFGSGVGATLALSRSYVSNREKDAAGEAMELADELMDSALEKKDKCETLEKLGSIPFARPMPLASVVKLVKRLQSALQSKEIPGGSGTVNDLDDSPTTDALRGTNIEWERLLDDIEPYIYGKTPMCEGLLSLWTLFADAVYESKVLVLVSDGASTDGDPRPAAAAIRDTGGKVFACLITDSTVNEERKLPDPETNTTQWSASSRTMFEMASAVSCDSSATQFLRRRGWELPLSGKCKLFVRANSPMIIEEFTTASRHLGTSADALSDMIGEISLDSYIQASNARAMATDQRGRSICWAHACASIIHLSSKRVVGRKVKEILEIRQELLEYFGDNDGGQSTANVLRHICPKYRLRTEEISETEARAAVHARRPVVATFYLDGNHWWMFDRFFKTNPKGILTAKDMKAPPGGKREDADGHAVVLVRCDDQSLTFMNSWGEEFGNDGFFSIDGAKTLRSPGERPMQFFDVFWLEKDLSRAEKATWENHKAETGKGLIGKLPKSFHELPVTCEHCKATTEARGYDGAWYEARCRACSQTFKPTVAALIRTLYDRNCEAGVVESKGIETEHSI